MKNVTFFLMFIQIFLTTGTSFANEKWDVAIINKNYQTVIEDIERSGPHDWRDYYYLAVSSHYLGNKNASIVNGVKSLLLNPFYDSVKSNLEIFGLEDKEILFRLESAAKLSFLLSALSIIFLIFLLIFRRKKRVIFSLVISQMFISIYFYFLRDFHYLNNLNKISIQASESNMIRLSPSEDSPLNSRFRSDSLLITGRSVAEWVYVENLEGEPGWINKKYLVL